jgi:uncharacterized protein YicC (UPF0701 family)
MSRRRSSDKSAESISQELSEESQWLLHACIRKELEQKYTKEPKGSKWHEKLERLEAHIEMLNSLLAEKKMIPGPGVRKVWMDFLNSELKTKEAQASLASSHISNGYAC